jgi:acetoin utilization deacetylase AcuC-like enzyme/formylglycine-generating enzyme required for sulfatase activity
MRRQLDRRTVEVVHALLVLALVTGCRQSKEPTKAPEVIETTTGIQMVVIPGGWSEIGSNAGAADERPAHKVWVDAFLMDKFEVTQDEFRKYQLPDPSHFKDPKNPLEQINWTDATLYCNERSRAEGLKPCYDEETWQCNFDANGYRLPTEAEWEYGCRAGTSTRYSFGDNPRRLRSYAWFGDNSRGRTHPVGQKKPNRWGLYDMHGNVAEWCNDFYSADYYKHSPEKNPRGPSQAKQRVLRGGAWNSSPESCRSSYRTSDPSIDDTCLASDAIGFRCVRSALQRKVPNPNPERANMVNTNAKTGFVYDDIYLEHKTTPGYPERPERLVAIVDKLKTSGVYTQLLPLSPKPATIEWITMVHSPQYIERVRKSCRNGTQYLDSIDGPISPKSYEAALMAAGGVLCAIDAVMDKSAKNAFCAVRPPGHHAVEDRAMGFCIFNNIAIGAKYIQKKYKLEKVLIVDWDVHHGNATQAAFYDDPSVLYFSVHQYPFYPGTGGETEKGAGQGLNYTINVPLLAGAGDDIYLSIFQEKLKPAALDFCPDFVLISAGFDAHKDDLLGSMKVTADGFAQLTHIVKDIAERCCDGRIVSTLEGGYHLQGLADSVEAHIHTLMQ